MKGVGVDMSIAVLTCDAEVDLVMAVLIYDSSADSR